MTLPIAGGFDSLTYHLVQVCVSEFFLYGFAYRTYVSSAHVKELNDTCVFYYFICSGKKGRAIKAFHYIKGIIKSLNYCSKLAVLTMRGKSSTVSV